MIDKVYKLVPGIRAVDYGGVCFIYDASATTGPIVRVQTQRVPRQALRIVQHLLSQRLDHAPQPLNKIKSYFTDASDLRAVDVLIRRGYLEAYSGTDLEAYADTDPGQTNNSDDPSTVMCLDRHGGHTRAANIDINLRAFEFQEHNRAFRPSTFFNLPTNPVDVDVQVGMLGIPFTSVPESIGTGMGPAFLRTCTQHANWLDCYENGIYSEISMDGGRPRTLCRGVTVQDFGDLTMDRCPTVGLLFGEIERFINEVVIAKDIRPLFIGGDHAITFPLVGAMLKQHPELCVIHFDAHNDLFYSQQLVYSHATPFSNLLAATSLSRIVSLGLRTSAATMNAGKVSALNEDSLEAKIDLYSIGATKRLLHNPTQLTRLLDTLPPSTPCYFSIDIDVLSPGEIAGRTSTPVGAGLDWWELFELVESIANHVNLVGCDVVEVNPATSSGTGTTEDNSNYATLVALLIHHLGPTS